MPEGKDRNRKRFKKCSFLFICLCYCIASVVSVVSVETMWWCHQGLCCLEVDHMQHATNNKVNLCRVLHLLTCSKVNTFCKNKASTFYRVTMLLTISRVCRLAPLTDVSAGISTDSWCTPDIFLSYEHCFNFFNWFIGNY